MTITVEGPPVRAMADEPFNVVVTGLVPESPITIGVEMHGYLGRAWRARFAATADQLGVVDLAKVALDGFDQPDPGALLWALEPDDDAANAGAPRTAPPDDVRCSIAIGQGTDSATHEFVRVFREKGVAESDVDRPLAGSLYLPPGRGPHPAVVTVSGSGGGIDRLEAALLASRGFACLALAYFSFPGRPSELIDIPLEYFGDALEWLADQPGIRPTAIATMGRSRGGELSLQLASRFPSIRAAVAIVPSGYRWGAMTEDGRPGAAWTWQGRPLPWVHGKDSDWEQFVTKDGAVELTPTFRAAIANAAAEELDAATIEVERGTAPLLLLCGGDDAMWDSVELSDTTVERARTRTPRRDVRRIVYPGAGHNISLPYLPVLTSGVHPVDGARYAFGGSRAGTAAARVQGWREVLEFLGVQLG